LPLYKARYPQLHLTDDQGWTFPFPKYPRLGTRNYGARGGVAPRVYRLDELKELVAAADARGVTPVPELEVPGRSGAALRSVPEVFDAINPPPGRFRSAGIALLARTGTPPLFRARQIARQFT
jgi:N-acetyl-beta-hexosaminidase